MGDPGPSWPPEESTGSIVTVSPGATVSFGWNEWSQPKWWSWRWMVWDVLFIGLDVDMVVVDRDVHGVDEDRVRAAQAVGLHREPMLVEDGGPGGVLHDVDVDRLPCLQPPLRLRRVGHGVGRGGPGDRKSTRLNSSH